MGGRERFSSQGLLTYRLTGERASEISDMSGGGLLRLPEAVYDADFLALYGLADATALLPPLPIRPTSSAS